MTKKEQTAQDVFTRLEQNKEKLREVNRQIKEHYESNSDYANLVEQGKAVGEKKKQLRVELNGSIEKLLESRDDLKIDVASDKDLLTDILLIKVAKQEETLIKDKYQQTVMPLFTVKFKAE